MPRLLSCLFIFCLFTGPSPAAPQESNRAQELWDQRKAHKDAYSHYLDQQFALNKFPSPFEQNSDINVVVKIEAELLRLANEGDRTAQYYCGVMSFTTAEAYEKSESVSANDYAATEYKAAMHWWRPLADSGDIDAQWRIGEMYAYGKGVSKSPLNAMEWLYKAAVGFKKHGDREHALMVLDDMHSLSETNPLTKKLDQLLLNSRAP